MGACRKAASKPNDRNAALKAGAVETAADCSPWNARPVAMARGRREKLETRDGADGWVHHAAANASSVTQMYDDKGTAAQFAINAN